MTVDCLTVVLPSRRRIAWLRRSRRAAESVKRSASDKREWVNFGPVRGLRSFIFDCPEGRRHLAARAKHRVEVAEVRPRYVRRSEQQRDSQKGPGRQLAAHRFLLCQASPSPPAPGAQWRSKVAATLHRRQRESGHDSDTGGDLEAAAPPSLLGEVIAVSRTPRDAGRTARRHPANPLYP